MSPEHIDSAAVRQVRSFNRTVAERIGALDDRFLGRPRPIGESRALWEIGPEGIEVWELRRRLSLDSGHLSRVLRSLQRQGLVTIGARPDDCMVRRVRLTAVGIAERAELDRRSDAIAQSALEPLTETERARLVTAMVDVERLLRASMVRFAVEDPASRDARWCIEQYFRELDSRFDTGFDPSRSIPADVHELTPPAGALILGRLRGRPVGCGALKFHAGAPAELKRMWVARQARGLGIGRRLLQVLEEHARDAGVHVVRLETNRALREAIELYRSAGYTEVAAFNDEPHAHYWFEKRLSVSRRRRHAK